MNLSIFQQSWSCAVGNVGLSTTFFFFFFSPPLDCLFVGTFIVDSMRCGYQLSKLGQVSQVTISIKRSCLALYLISRYRYTCCVS